MFKCDKCGICCRNIWKNDIFKELDRGDGVCKYLEGNLCSVYEERPLFCRVDECYEIFFKDKMSKEKFYEINYNICKTLKKENYVSGKIK